MAEEKVLLGDDVVGRETPEYKTLLDSMTEIERVANKVVGSVKPSLLNERYFSTEEVMAHFHISKRALQNYRDTGVIPYTAIGGIFLQSPGSGKCWRGITISQFTKTANKTSTSRKATHSVFWR